MKIEAPATIPEASQAIDAVKAAVAREFGITLDDINSQSRREPLPMIRHIGMALCHELVEYVTLLSIAEAFGRSHPQTVLHAIEATKERCEISVSFSARVSQVRLAAKRDLAVLRRTAR